MSSGVPPGFCKTRRKNGYCIRANTEKPVSHQKVRKLTQEEWQLESAKRGDKKAMAALALQYEGLCRKAAGQSHLAPLGEDALSAARESFLGAVRAFDTARGVPFPGFAKAKVYGDLRTLFKAARRQWQREVLPEGAEEESVLDGVPDERDGMRDFEAADAFRRMLAPLAERPRRLLTMLYARGLTQKEAAARLGISPQAAAVMKARALKTLRKNAGAA